MFERALDQWQEINNHNEGAVLEQIEALCEGGLIVCQCRECMLDMIALALNSLPPRYSVSLMQKFYDTPEKERVFRDEIKAAVGRAVEKVRRSPHH